jgi:DNA-binding MarR family transcriptional regulator
MSYVTSERGAGAGRRRLTSAVKDSLRELNLQLSLLGHRVGAELQLKDVDFDCLELITRHGPLSPGAVARRTGLHAATVTGILDRLERDGWVARERDPVDRRGVVVRALRDRSREVFHQFAGMNSAMDRLCDSYSDDELKLITDFLRRTVEAGRVATDAVGSGLNP